MNPFSKIYLKMHYIKWTFLKNIFQNALHKMDLFLKYTSKCTRQNEPFSKYTPKCTRYKNEPFSKIYLKMHYVK